MAARSAKEEEVEAARLLREKEFASELAELHARVDDYKDKVWYLAVSTAQPLTQPRN